ncbi:MAG: hypothetical protein IJ777_02510 [Clostridia bacterium]|nr:hypothetical protein [Clostridia bacterium]
MSKEMKIAVTILIIILLLFAILFAVYSHFQSKPMEANIARGENILPDANTGLENMLNAILNEETVGNVESMETENAQKTNEQNDVQNTQTTQNTSKNNSSSEQETEDDSSSTPREKKAIELVKKEWEKEMGNLSGVSFNNIGIQSDGKYRVSVNDSKTTRVLQFYIVDVDTGVVKEK